MKKLNLIALPLTLLSSAAFATSTQVYIEQNVASNAADYGVYTTEAGALIDTSENGQVYIGFDDQGWLAAGYGHDFHISESFTFNLYGELGKWDNGEELLIEGIIDYQVNDNFNVFSGLGYNQSGQVPEKLSDTTINTNKFIAGAGYSLAGWDLAYQYTHENRDGSNVGTDLIDQDDYRTNEHEVVLSKSIDDWTPYVKYTYFNTNEGDLQIGGGPMIPIDNDSIITLGLSYDF
ncbi:hypothetical protein J5X89_02185 [Vibrio sp. G41H]|uniref:hypothetical protein n=1 Tax=unclassified Vibrio TaxID=2614977 RepID=UPI001AD6AB2C|nr:MULTISPECIES: hypothetical protein [unclassified Vibrio]MBO7910424.1 hypothetical protein [Vibrio sp. G41H]MCF7489253.1 hypothetical protein [Vibrio sp. G-C-1]